MSLKNIIAKLFIMGADFGLPEDNGGPLVKFTFSHNGRKYGFSISKRIPNEVAYFYMFRRRGKQYFKTATSFLAHAAGFADYY